MDIESDAQAFSHNIIFNDAKRKKLGSTDDEQTGLTGQEKF